ncbi:glycosyltransferase family 4 protein [Frateuria defendens]|uniref:glycosyltransferase family 4 protein n=1 Tax=Frateuria defendens TaxID=2219559 RepID=UPI00066FCD08|nr:glycosyltransferase family 4 protein [Frateuria defendens]
MKFVFFANTDWYLYNFRLSTAQRLQAEGHEVVMLSPPGEFGVRFAAHGFRWLVLPMDRASLNPWREALTLRRLVRLLERERPDLLHNFTVKCAVYGALAARAARVPAVVNAVAGMGYVFTCNRPKARLLRPLVGTLMRIAFDGRRSLLVLQNPDDAEVFVRSRTVAPGRIRVIRSSGVDTARFQPPATRLGGAARLRVLLAARLLWEKGVGEFVEAARLLAAEGREVEFLLAGTPDPGNPRAVAEAQVRQWAGEGVVRWLGHVEDMPALLARVDAMALPSYYCEGVPKCLIEGAACGLAIITTGRPGCREVVAQDGIDGLRVPPRDARALADCIARLDDDRELLRRLGCRARQKALEEFDERLVIQRTIEVYEELLKAEALPGVLARPVL